MAQPTKTELLILNCIIYTRNFRKYDFTDKTIYDWACQFDSNAINNENKPAEISKLEWKNIIITIKNNKDVYNKMLIKDIDNSQYANSSGSQRVTNATITYDGDTIIVYQGTAGDLEWRDNGVGGYSTVISTNQQIGALDYFDTMKKQYGIGNIYLTGHSKGGNKAQYVTVLRGNEITATYSFDAQGFGLPFLNKYKQEIIEHRNKITNICNENDFVNIVFQNVAGKVEYIRNNSTLGLADMALDNFFTLLINPSKFIVSNAGSALLHKFGGWHSPYTMFCLDANGNLMLDKETDQSFIMAELKEFFDYCQKYMPEEDWRYLCFTLMSAMMDSQENYGGIYNVMPKDFVDRFSFLLSTYTRKNKGFNIPILWSSTDRV